MKRNIVALIVLLVCFLSLGAFFVASSKVLAKPLLDSLFGTDLSDSVKFAPNVTIPGSEFQAGSSQEIKVTSNEVQGNLAGEYIAALYKFFVGIAGIVAVLVIAVGGFVWLFSGGSSDKISTAKELIFGAVAGLLLAVGSYLILYTINPQLVDFKLAVPLVEDLGGISTGYCPYSAFKAVGAERYYGDCGQTFNYRINGLTDYYGCTFAKCETNQICVKEGLSYSCKGNKFELAREKLNLTGAEYFSVIPNTSTLVDAVKSEAGVTPQKNSTCGLIVYETKSSGIKAGWIENLCSCDKKDDGRRILNLCVIDSGEGNCSPLSAKNGALDVCRDSTAECACEGSVSSANCTSVQNTKDGCTGVVGAQSQFLKVAGKNVVMAMQPGAVNELLELAQAASTAQNWPPRQAITNGSLAIKDMFRGPGVQEYLNCQNPGLANEVGKSYHEKGMAFDVNYEASGITESEYQAWLALAEQFSYKPAATGWGEAEYWHFTYQGGDSGDVACPSS